LGNSCSNRGKQTKIFTGITGKLPIFEWDLRLTLNLLPVHGLQINDSTIYFTCEPVDFVNMSHHIKGLCWYDKPFWNGGIARFTGVSPRSRALDSERRPENQKFEHVIPHIHRLERAIRFQN
jgi:hypothetical protein